MEPARKYWIAMAAYATIAILAAFTLDGKFRILVLIVMGYFAVRTHIAHKAGW